MKSRGSNLSVFLSGAEYDRLEKVCEDTGINKSQLTKRALALYLTSAEVRNLKRGDPD